MKTAAEFENCVDVILPAFNAADKLPRAVESIIHQKALNRVIIVNDASPDDTASVLSSLAEKYPKVLAISLRENVGPAQARNLAVAQSTAPWITLLDSDDWMDEDRLSALLRHAEADRADIVADDIFMHQPDGSVGSVWSETDFSPFFMSPAFFAQMNIARYTGAAREFGYIKPLFRTEILQRESPPWRADLRIMEDYDLYMRCLVAGDRFLFAPRAGYHYDRGTASRAFRPNNLKIVVETDRSNAKRVSDPEAKRWLGLHADQHEALLLWVDVAGNKKLSKLPSLLARSVLRPAIGSELVERLGRRLVGLQPDRPRVRDIPKGTPAYRFAAMLS